MYIDVRVYTCIPPKYRVPASTTHPMYRLYIHSCYCHSPRYISPKEPLPIFLPSRYLPPTRSSMAHDGLSTQFEQNKRITNSWRFPSRRSGSKRRRLFVFPSSQPSRTRSKRHQRSLAHSEPVVVASLWGSYDELASYTTAWSAMPRPSRIRIRQKHLASPRNYDAAAMRWATNRARLYLPGSSVPHMPVPVLCLSSSYPKLQSVIVDTFSLEW